MALPLKPDPEWVATLRKDDEVGVADMGRLVYVAVVKKRTPTGLLRVGHEEDENPSSWCSFHPNGYMRDLVYGSRYLVAPETL